MLSWKPSWTGSKSLKSKMNYLEILSGRENPLPIYSTINACLDNPENLPVLIEQIYHEALNLRDEETDSLRFALLRLQIYADIHHYENLEESQKIRYTAQVIEKVVFGSLLLEPDQSRIE